MKVFLKKKILNESYTYQNKFKKHLLNEIPERLSHATEELDIEAIKRHLIKLSKSSSWEECIEKQKFGNCTRIVSNIYRGKFGKMFDMIGEVYVNYNKNACKKCAELGDEYFITHPENEWFGNHYVLIRDGKIYDFAKGANSILGVYLLDKPAGEMKYDVEWSKDEYNKITKSYYRYMYN